MDITRSRSARVILLAGLLLAGFLSACATGVGEPAQPTTTVERVGLPTQAAATPTGVGEPAQPTTTVERVDLPTQAAPTTPTGAGKPAQSIAAAACGDQTPAMIPARAGDPATLPDASCYTLDVTVYPERSRLAGALQVRYTNREAAPLDAIVFRLYPNLPSRLGRAVVGGVSRDGQPVQTELLEQNTVLRVPLQPALAAGASATFGMTFEVDIPTSSKAGYQEFINNEGIIALAQFYPTIPARPAGQWDTDIPPGHGDVTVADAAFFRVRLTVPQAQIVAATGALIEQRDDLAAGTKTLHFVSGPAREFNAVMSADYQVAARLVGGTQVRSFFLTRDRVAGERALDVAARSLEVYNDLFGVYPYTELEIAPTTTTAGGIEYPGLIVLNRFYYQGSRNERFDWANAHEVAHQWWYNLVGNDQLREPWLDEALTNYATWLYYERTTTPAIASQLKQEVFQAPADEARRRNADQAIGLPVSAYAPENYGPIVYGKGPLFFDALRQRVGDEAFFKILRVYLQRYTYQMARGLDFLAVAEEVAGQDLHPLYLRWIANP